MAERSPNVENYMLGKGKLYFDRFDADGASTGEMDLGNVPDFSLTLSIESLDHYESMSGIKEKDKSVDVTVGANVKFTMDELSRWNLMIAINGITEGTFSQGSGHQVNEVITAHLGKYSKLSRRNTHDVVVTNTAGTVTYTETTDYTVDRSSGRIFVTETGSITDGQTLHVDYLYDDTTYGQLIALEDTSVEGSLRFVGDPAVGPKYEVEIWKVKVKPTGDLKFITDEWATIEVEGEVLKDASGHPTMPWFRMLDITTNESAVS